MKKIIKTLLVVMVLVLALTALVGCEDKPVETTPVVYEGHEGHNVAKIDAVEATCSKAGLTEGAYCVDCREMIVVQETIEKIEHVWVANEDRAFTCTLDGYTGGMHCEICGIQDGNTVITKAHCVYEGAEPYVYTEPTCVKEGILAHNCTVCGKAAVVEEIPATGEHSFTVDVEAKANTCGADGYTAHKACDVCGAKNDEYEVLAATGEHSFTVAVEALAPDCENAGYTAHNECDVCGAKDENYETVAKLGHNFPEESYFVGKAPTCTEQGILAGVCSNCGKAYGLQYIPVDPDAHTSNGTCTEDGTCTGCGVAVEAPGHTWVGGDCTTPATCSACKAEGELVHNVGEDGVCADCGTVFVDTAEALIAALAAGKNVVLTADITMDATLKCPYGNPVGVAQKGGVLDGNGHTLTVNGSGNYYAIITYGGTIKNLKINAGFRAVVTYTPTEDVVLDNVTIVGDSIGYGFNTAEHATLEGIDLVVKNSTICGWVSFDGGFESVSFENCNFVQGTYNNNVVGRLVKPYVSTTFTNCTFVKNAYLDLSALAAGETVTLVGCKVAGVDVTVDVFTTEEDHAEIPFTYEEPKGVELVLTAVEGGVSFHRHGYVADVTAPTCTAAGKTVYTCACGHTYEEAGEAATGHAYAEGICGNCGATDPNHYFVVSIADALKKSEGAKVQLSGTVTEIYQAYSSQYNNISVWITDENGDRILVFRVTGNYGIGDKLTIKGNITMYNEKPQIAQGATVVSSEKHVCSDFTEATCLNKAKCVVCGVETGELADHNYVDGKCICGAEQGGVEPTTVSKTMKELIAQYGWTGSTTKQSFSLDDVVSVKINGGSNTGKAYNGDHIRIYATDTPAGTITITVPEGYELVSIKISTQTGTYAFLHYNSADICNKTISVSGNSVVLNSVKNGSDGKQVRVTGIEVTYKPVG